MSGPAEANPITYRIHREQLFDSQVADLDDGYRKKIEGVIEDELKVNPYTCGQLLKGELGNKGIRKIRIGNYRLFYVIRENPGKVVALLSIDDRGSAY